MTMTTAEHLPFHILRFAVDAEKRSASEAIDSGEWFALGVSPSIPAGFVSPDLLDCMCDGIAVYVREAAANADEIRGRIRGHLRRVRGAGGMTTSSTEEELSHA